MTDIAELRTLLAAATPRPWKWWRDDGAIMSEQPQHDETVACGQPLNDGTARVAIGDADVTLLCVAVNALPELLDEIENLLEQAQVDRGSLHEWAHGLLQKWAGYPHVNSDPFDSLEHGQLRDLVWEYASELVRIQLEARRENLMDALAAANAEAARANERAARLSAVFEAAEGLHESWAEAAAGLDPETPLGRLLAAVDAARKEQP